MEAKRRIDPIGEYYVPQKNQSLYSITRQNAVQIQIPSLPEETSRVRPQLRTWSDIAHRASRENRDKLSS
jgi:hypothetical protein